MTIPRRSESSYAGQMCSFKKETHLCTLYARYLVTHEKDDRTISKTGIGTCGVHLPIFVREIWRHHGGAVVLEIPGMWR
jgi:hypothetical protein